MKTVKNSSGYPLAMKMAVGALFASSIFLTQPASAENVYADMHHSVTARFKLSTQQVENLALVKKYATESGHPETIQAMMLQETGAGQNVRSHGTIHGIMQIMTSTAQGILKWNARLKEKYFGHKEPSHKMVAQKLKTDKVFSIEVADNILAKTLEETNNLDRAVFVYNQGDGSLKKGSPAKSDYVKGVKDKRKTIIKPINALLTEKDETIWLKIDQIMSSASEDQPSMKMASR